MIKINTDEIGFGKDDYNYILGFVYDATEFYFELPGGLGQISTLNFN